jgi:hypothetical protein
MRFRFDHVAAVAASAVLIVIAGVLGISSMGASSVANAAKPTKPHPTRTTAPTTSTTTVTTAPTTSTSTTTVSTAPTTTVTTGPTTTTAPAPTSVVTKALVIFVENHSFSQMQSGMPYLNSLATTYGYATNYQALTHPSLPNYLAVAGGSTFGITDDNNPSSHQLSGPTVFGQALAMGKTARVYAEDEPSTCYQSDAGLYVVHHTAWPYFVDEAAACRTNQPPLGSATSGAFATDAAAGTLPNVGWLIPNNCNNAHNCSLATADTWIKTMLSDVFNGPDWQSGRLAVVITADEDDYNGTNTVLTVVAHPSLHSEVVTSALNHYSLSAFLSAMSGSAPLRNAAGAPSFANAFGLAIP